MKLWTITLTLLSGLALACDQNCYLGAGLYSAPLDSKGCCMTELDPNCFSYMSLGQGRFVCRQCQLGYRWDNDKCVKYADNDICVNPDIVSSEFVLCKVCRIKNKINIPIEREVNGRREITCHEISPASPEGKLMVNCMASALHNGVVFCHQCQPGYYYDGMDQKCMPQTTCKEMAGCMLSFVKNKCDLCRHEYQYNMFTFTCVARTERIDYEHLKAQMQIKMRQQAATEQRLRNDPEMAGLVGGFNIPGQQMGHQGYLRRTEPLSSSNFPSGPLGGLPHAKTTSGPIRF